MYSDRPRRGGFGGGGGGGGGGGYRRDGESDWRSRQSDQGGESTEVFVGQSLVGRIIGKGGSKIRELEDSSGAGIKVNSREVQNGQVQIVITGSDEARGRAEDLINDIVETFEGDSRGGGGGGYGGRSGGGGYGGGGRGGGYDGGRGGRSSTCYQCGKEGHFARDCPEQQSGY